MNWLLKFMSENALASSLVAAALVGVVGWALKSRRDNKDSETIYQYLVSSQSETEYRFRSTEAISSRTHIPETRVAALCARHPKIRRNEKEKQSWTLVS